MASVLANFVHWFFGSLTKSVDGGGNVVWTLPCDLATGIEGNPRLPGEGLACYFKRLLAEGVAGLNGVNSYATLGANFTQPAVNSSTTVQVDTTAGFAANQYVWSEEGGFYFVTAVIDATHVTLKNLRPAPDNLAPGGTVHATKRIFVSGPAAIPGATGATGAAGTSSFLYIGYASNSLGAGFTLSPVAPTNSYIAFKVSPVFIPSPDATTFTGLWIKYKGDVGPTGPPGPSAGGFPGYLVFKKAGVHSWVCPSTGVSSIRVRVYGGSGGGGGGASTANGGGNGNGGGGGEYAQGILTPVPGRTYSIQVGSAGTGGSGGGAGANGTNGGASIFYDTGATYLTANGGHGGGASVGGSVGIGGTGGTGTITPEAQSNGIAGGIAGDNTLGGHCGRLGAGGLGGADGEQPGGGGGGGLGDAGGPGAVGGNGAAGQVEIEVLS